MSGSDFLDRVLVTIGKILGEKKHRDENAKWVSTDIYSDAGNRYELTWRVGNTLDIIHMPRSDKLSGNPVSRIYLDYGLWTKPRALATMIAGIIEGYDLYQDQWKED